MFLATTVCELTNVRDSKHPECALAAILLGRPKTCLYILEGRALAGVSAALSDVYGGKKPAASDVPTSDSVVLKPILKRRTAGHDAIAATIREFLLGRI